MQVIGYGPSKMGYDAETDETYFTSELLVDGKNSGMFINRALFSLLKKFYAIDSKSHIKESHLSVVVRQMHFNALFPVDVGVLTDFLLQEIKNAK